MNTRHDKNRAQQPAAPKSGQDNGKYSYSSLETKHKPASAIADNIHKSNSLDRVSGQKNGIDSKVPTANDY